jgi:hypothetical protein
MGQYVGLDIPFLNPAGTTFIGNTVVVATDDGDGSHRVVPGYAVAGATPPLGVVIDNNDPVNGPTLPIAVRCGGIIDCIAGAAIDPAVQPMLTWNASGQVIPVPATAATITGTIGSAMEGCSTIGDKISVLVHPGTYTHP